MGNIPERPFDPDNPYVIIMATIIIVGVAYHRKRK